MPDINCLLGEILGTLFTPNEFRLHQDLCRDGCVSKKEFMSLFRKLDIDFDLLVKLLCHYEVSLKQQRMILYSKKVHNTEKTFQHLAETDLPDSNPQETKAKIEMTYSVK